MGIQSMDINGIKMMYIKLDIVIFQQLIFWREESSLLLSKLYKLNMITCLYFFRYAYKLMIRSHVLRCKIFSAI